MLLVEFNCGSQSTEFHTAHQEHWHQQLYLAYFQSQMRKYTFIMPRFVRTRNFDPTDFDGPEVSAALAAQNTAITWGWVNARNVGDFNNLREPADATQTIGVPQATNASKTTEDQERLMHLPRIPTTPCPHFGTGRETESAHGRNWRVHRQPSKVSSMRMSLRYFPGDHRVFHQMPTGSDRDRCEEWEEPPHKHWEYLSKGPPANHRYVSKDFKKCFWEWDTPRMEADGRKRTRTCRPDLCFTNIDASLHDFWGIGTAQERRDRKRKAKGQPQGQSKTKYPRINGPRGRTGGNSAQATGISHPITTTSELARILEFSHVATSTTTCQREKATISNSRSAPTPEAPKQVNLTIKMKSAPRPSESQGTSGGMAQTETNLTPAIAKTSSPTTIMTSTADSPSSSTIQAPSRRLKIVLKKNSAPRKPESREATCTPVQTDPSVSSSKPDSSPPLVRWLPHKKGRTSLEPTTRQESTGLWVADCQDQVNSNNWPSKASNISDNAPPKVSPTPNGIRNPGQPSSQEQDVASIPSSKLDASPSNTVAATLASPFSLPQLRPTNRIGDTPRMVPARLVTIVRPGFVRIQVDPWKLTRVVRR